MTILNFRTISRQIWNFRKFRTTGTIAVHFLHSSCFHCHTYACTWNINISL